MKHSPLIYSYLKRYQDDPTSRVFAPLAEAYRKAGMVNEAIEVAREGLAVHPQFVGGRVALARALADKKDYQGVVDELGPVIRDNPDNLLAQKLFAEANLLLGRLAEALGAYKMLLYLMPADPELSRLVSELEAQAYEQGRLVLRTDPPPAPENDPADAFAMTQARGAIDQDPDVAHARWVKKIEVLQALLQRVERYKTDVRSKTRVLA